MFYTENHFYLLLSAVSIPNVLNQACFQRKVFRYVLYPLLTRVYQTSQYPRIENLMLAFRGVPRSPLKLRRPEVCSFSSRFTSHSASVRITPILYYHVIYQNTRFHEVLDVIVEPEAVWACKNMKPTYQDSKISFDVLSNTFLCVRELLFFSSARVAEFLHKGSPFGVYAVLKVVNNASFHSFDLLECSWRKLTGYVSANRREVVEYVDIISRPGASKEIIPYPYLPMTGLFKNYSCFLLFSLKLPSPGYGYSFHSQ